MLEPILAEIVDTSSRDTTPAHYVVRLPAFEGPLELLLHLIEKQQMEITTISLLAVTDQYLAYLQRWQERGDLPLANMAAFISIATRLLFIKSQSLLPSTSKQEMSEDLENAAAMAEELRRHLLEYRQAKEIARHLRQREEAGLQTYSRSGLLAGIEAQLAWAPPTLLGMEIQSLALAFQRLLELHARETSDSNGLLPLERVRVSDRIAVIIAQLNQRERIEITELIERESSRLAIIVTFLAVLEMWKRERITVHQEMLFGCIYLERGPRWTDAKHDDESDEQTT